MSLETATYIDALVTSNPDGTDARTTADDHLRLIKAALKRTFPNITAAVSASAAELNFAQSLSASVQLQLNQLRDGTATAFAALVCRYANSASYAVLSTFATSAGYAQSASYAAAAGAAATAVLAATANSASYAAIAGTAATAANATALGGVAAAGYAQLSTAQSWTGGQAVTQHNFTGSGNLTAPCQLSTMFKWTLSGNANMLAPANARSGMVITFHLKQDAIGSRQIVSWDSVFKFAGGSVPTLSTAPGAVDVFSFQYDSVDGVWRAGGLAVS